MVKKQRTLSSSSSSMGQFFVFTIVTILVTMTPSKIFAQEATTETIMPTTTPLMDTTEAAATESDLVSSSSTVAVETPSNSSSSSMIPGGHAASKTILENAAVELYKQKSAKILQFLNDIVPEIQQLRTNMSDLLKNYEKPGKKIPLSEFKKVDHELDQSLDEIEYKMDRNHDVRLGLSQLVNYTEHQLTHFHNSFETLLHPQRAHNQNGGDAGASCGGLIHLSTTTMTLEYTRISKRGPTPRSPDPDMEEETCVWLVSAPGKEIESSLVMLEGGRHDNSVGLPVNENGLLSYHGRFHGTVDSSSSIKIGSYDVHHRHRNLPVANDYMVIVFSTLSTKGSPSFRVSLTSRWSSSGNNVNPIVNFNLLTPTDDSRHTLQYPLGRASYQNFERQFWLIKPTPSRYMVMRLLSIRTANLHDQLNLFKFTRSNGGEFKYVTRYTGNMPHGNSMEHYSYYKEPMLLVFSSDGSMVGNGFSVSYGNALGMMWR